MYAYSLNHHLLCFTCWVQSTLFSQICWLKWISSMQFHSSADPSPPTESHTHTHTHTSTHCRSANRHANRHTHPCAHISVHSYRDSRLSCVFGHRGCIYGWVLQTVRQTKVTLFFLNLMCSSFPNNPANHKQCVWLMQRLIWYHVVMCFHLGAYARWVCNYESCGSVLVS